MPSRRTAADPEEEGRVLVERLGGRWTETGGLCRCPAHDDRTPSLSVRPGRTRILVHCFAGCSAGAVLRALERAHLLEPNPSTLHATPDVGGKGRLSAAARSLWDKSRSVPRTAAEAYLAARGLSTQSEELRFHPRAPHGRRPLTRFRPALIAAVRDESGLTGIHRTFLDEAVGARCRKFGLGRFGRGAVRLGGVAPRLGLAEGIETALSATALFGTPCWATLGTERFGLIALPAEVRSLSLFLDHDRGGRRAEQLARVAFAHRAEIEVHMPSWPGADWNDVLRRVALPEGCDD